MAITGLNGKDLAIREDVAGEVVLVLDGVESTFPVEELARALMDNSPSFTRGVGEIAQRAIFNALRDSDLD